MTQPPPTAADLDALRHLLADVDTPPLEHADQLRRARERLVADPAVALDLDRLELRFLERQARRRDASPELVRAVREPRVVSLDRTLRRIRAGVIEPVQALFDLAELSAAYLREGCDVEAAAARQLMRERVAHIEVDAAVAEEARERFAAVITEEEDLDAAHRIHLLTELALVLEGLARRSEDRLYRRLARRLRMSAGDRGLYRNLERVLTRRGVVIMETTSLVLLLVVFALLAIEATVAMPERSLHRLQITDAVICSFFILEFLFKFALAPRRWSWAARNVCTDLLPAIPAVLLVFDPVVTGFDSLASVRAVRLLRLAAFARYLTALRPVLGLFRLLLFLIRGLDALVERFSALINRNFVFFETGTHRGDEVVADTPRRLVFQAIRREHVLIDDQPAAAAHELLLSRARHLAERLRTREVVHATICTPGAEARDVPVEEAIERLYAVQPEEVGMTMSRADIRALDRVSRVINAPVIRSLPFVRWFRSKDPGDTPEQRVVSLGRRIADRMEWWRNRILFFADLHGIVTGPQILDRVATAMVRASQRPAVRLLLFGGLFSIVRMLQVDGSFLDRFLGRFVATPLVVLGVVCLLVLLIGRWLKRLAGEAAETLKRTSEAHFINLLELEKARTRDSDLVYLARRIFRFEMDDWEAALALGQNIQEASAMPVQLLEDEQVKEAPEAVREDLSRVAFLYLHFLDGAILHESDIKTTEQLLANLSLENIRRQHLRFSRRDRKRVRRLSLASGSILSGPYLWFRFITESVSLETAKRITEYNRHCITLQQRRVATAEELREMDAWMVKRRGEVEGRIIERIEPPDAGLVYQTTEFNAIDFLSASERRDAQIERVFGREVLELLRLDRRSMIREIFGTRPLHKLPRSQRSVNFYRIFLTRLSRGRVLLAPLSFLGVIWWVLRNVYGKTSTIVREILHPESTGADRQSGAAPFRVALRKIHRMKAPGLLEAMLMRASFDPAYSGAPPTWSFGVTLEAVSEMERDMDFLQLRERERRVLRQISLDNRRRVEQLHDLVRELDVFERCESEIEQKLGERAVTIAYITNRDHLRSLFQARRYIDRVLPHYESQQAKVTCPMLRRLGSWLRRRCRRHPVFVLIDRELADRRVSRRGRANLRRAYDRDVGPTRDIVDAWLQLPAGAEPRDRAIAVARDTFRASGEMSRELVALRAVQTLSVLDVRNYRDLVFRLGGYAEDGEDPAIARALP